MKLPKSFSLRFKLVFAALAVEFLTIALITFQGVKLTQQNLAEGYANNISAFLPVLQSALLLPLIEEDIETLEEVFYPLVRTEASRIQAATLSNRNGDQLFVINSLPNSSPGIVSRDFRNGFDQAEFLLYLQSPLADLGYSVKIPLMLAGDLVGEVALVFDTGALQSSLTDTGRRGILVSSIAMLLGGLVFWLLGHRLTQHLGKMQQAAEQVSRGEYQVNIELQRNDELGQLALAFNKMAQRIESDRVQQHEQEQNILFTLNSIADGVIAIGPDYKITQINPVALELTGWQLSEARGKPVNQITEFVSSLDKSIIYPPICRAMEGGQVVSLDPGILMKGRDGAVRPIKAIASPIIGADQKIVGAIMVFHDDSEEVQSRRLLIQQQELLATAENVAVMGSWARDLKSNELFWSPGIFRMLGLEPKSQKPSLPLLLESLSVADRTAMMSTFDRTIEGEITDPLIINVRRDEQHQTKLELYFHCFYEDNKPVRVIGIARDVTDLIAQQQARHETEQMLSSIMDIAPALIVVKSVDGTILHCNKTHADVFGLTPDELIGKTSYDFHSVKEAELITSRDRQVLESAQRWQLTETLFDGNENRVFHSVRTPLLDEAGNPFGLLYTGWDITERTEQEQQHRSRVKMEALGKLTGGIAHDYNNMLAVINGYAELLALQLSGQPQASGYVDEILRAGQRGAQLTRRLLGFASRQPGESEPVNINELLERNNDLLANTSGGRVELQFNLANSLWLTQLDEGEFEDSVINLVINANHAMTAGGSLTITTKNLRASPYLLRTMDLKKGEYVQVTFTDSGTGIDPNDIPHIFDPFFSTKGDQGSGLGLSQVYGFVRRCGGDVRVVSKLGEGSRFELFFPRTSKKPVSSQRKLITTSVPESDNEQVLLVHNEPVLTQLTGEILSSQRYKIVAVATPEQALEKLAELENDGRPARLLISDVTMAIMDGPELAAQARQHYPQLKVLFFSGHGDPSRSLVQAGVSGLLSKPFTASELLEKVRNLLDEE